MPLKGLSKAFTRPYKGRLKVCIDKSEKDYEAWAFHGDLPLLLQSVPVKSAGNGISKRLIRYCIHLGCRPTLEASFSHVLC